MMCVTCHEKFNPDETPGAILLAPQGVTAEDGGAPTTKYHICPSCWPVAQHAVLKITRPLYCWECKSCGHEHWSRDRDVLDVCPGCKKESPTWIGHKYGVHSTCDPISRIWRKEDGGI